MPSHVLSVGTTETGIKANGARTVLIIQNVDTVLTDYLWVSDDKDKALTHGVRLAGQGGSITIRRADGEEPEKAWYFVATTAATPVRVIELFGSVAAPPYPPYPEYPPHPEIPPTPTPPPGEPRFWF